VRFNLAKTYGQVCSLQVRPGSNLTEWSNVRVGSHFRRTEETQTEIFFRAKRASLLLRSLKEVLQFFSFRLASIHRLRR